MLSLLAIATGCSSSTTSSKNASLDAVAQSQPVQSASPASKPAPSTTPVAKPSAKPAPTKPKVKVKTHHPKAVALNDQAVGKLSKEDYRGALTTFNLAIQTDNKLAEAYLGRGIAYSGLRKHESAIQDFEQAISLDDSFAEAYLNRADEYAAIGKRERAIADFDKAAQLFSQRGDQENARIAQTRIVDLTPASPSVTTVTDVSTNAASSPSANTPEIALAVHLKMAGAKMYGTYWCSVCHWQREQFGQEAFSQITYVECDPGGTNPQPDLCNQAKIHAYPTWEINGRLYPPGGYPLKELANVSRYQGPDNFGG